MQLPLEKINSILQRNDAPVLKYLLEGLKREYITDRIKKIDLIFPEELFDLYSWRNGTKWEKGIKLGSLWFFPGALFFSLEMAIEIYSARITKDKYWKNKMFPVFGSGGGEFYLIDLDINSPGYKKIFYYCLNETDFEVIVSYFDSLEAGLMTILECYNEGAYYLESDDENDQMLNSHSAIERKISRRLNPNSEYWTLYE